MTCEQFPPKPLILNNRVKAFLVVIVNHTTRPPASGANDFNNESGIAPGPPFVFVLAFANPQLASIPRSHA
jgi:hypothetical protein